MQIKPLNTIIENGQQILILSLNNVVNEMVRSTEPANFGRLCFKIISTPSSG